MKTAQFKVFEGKIPILVSAPHGYIHRRPNLSRSYKGGEPYTLDIVKNICEDISCFGIFLNEECEYDPNYHKLKSNEYKKEVKNIVEREKIGKFVDIHGLKDTYDYDIAIYYLSHFPNSIALANDIANGLNKGLLNDANIQILRFVENGQETISEFMASKLRVPSVQIEIARYIREDEVLRKEFVKNLEDVLKKYI